MQGVAIIVILCDALSVVMCWNLSPWIAIHCNLFQQSAVEFFRTFCILKSVCVLGLNRHRLANSSLEWDVTIECDRGGNKDIFVAELLPDAEETLRRYRSITTAGKHRYGFGIFLDGCDWICEREFFNLSQAVGSKFVCWQIRNPVCDCCQYHLGTMSLMLCSREKS